MIEFAANSDKTNVINLWKICFGDTEEYISGFLDKRMTLNNCLIYRENGIILSMLFLLEGRVKISNEFYTSFYIYAACTDPEYRGKGLMGKLLERVFEIAVEDRMDYICLVPANAGLFGYYARFGFTVAFKKKEICVSRKQLNIIAADTAENCNPNIQEITELRNRVFSSGDYYAWDEKAVEYSIYENKSVSGNTVYVQHEGKLAGYAIFVETEENIIVKELCVLGSFIGQLVNLLVSSSKSDNFLFNLPLEFPLSSDTFKVIDNGMIKAISNAGISVISNINNAYIGLTLE